MNKFISIHNQILIVENIKLSIARIIDRLNDDACWMDLVMWALGYYGLREVDFTGRCKRPPNYDEKWGGCYCGKHQHQSEARE